jgi:tRNA nucleotidyltransferase/poly(A) polymerase
MNTDKAFDMLPYVVDIYEKLNIKAFIKANTKKVTGASKVEIEQMQKEAGENMIKFVVKNLPKIKREVYQILSIHTGQSIDEIKAQPPTNTIKSIFEMLGDKELTDFFKSAVL